MSSADSEYLKLERFVTQGSQHSRLSIIQSQQIEIEQVQFR
jgi:hypothetical protein